MGVPQIPNPTSANSTNEVNPKLRFIEPSFKLHTFAGEAVDKKVLFQVIKMLDSLIIFINLVDTMVLGDLSLGMFNTRTMREPIATQIMGDFVENVSKNMALKFARKLGKTVYISFNVSNDRLMLPAIEKRLCEEIKNKPDKF